MQQPATNYQSAPQNAGSNQFYTSDGLNPLVNAASVLLAVFSKTRDSINHPNVGGLHQQLEKEIKAFDTKARAQGIKSEKVIVARYVLCTILDEAVLNTPWGAESAWTQRTLLSMFHNETGGGEKFFAILDRMRESPAENLDFLELMYICLSLGYEGKYRVVARGRDNLEQLRDDLFQIIRSHRGDYERSLSPRWQGLGKIRNTLSSYMPMWVVASVVAGIMALSYSGFRYWLHRSTNHVASQLVEISETDITAKPKQLDEK
ncbi:DotU family type IV/VI secretion system protein [Aliikangiella coralliicola]|uniref:DotU family type IV/VI secretion system protein n=2 Tax=Aliikangiella coralliicola TaxID=2592383 RepID=A0A545U980_9GAMM|nr:DotU family type IV/VI secretion system protein [Aliikangiella coralliicola]